MTLVARIGLLLLFVLSLVLVLLYVFAIGARELYRQLVLNLPHEPPP